MCYYNRLIIPVSQSIQLGDYAIALPDGSPMAFPVQSGFEYAQWPIIRIPSGNDLPEALMAHWEFIAPWMKTMKDVEAGRQKYTTLNAVGEKVLESKLYREAALHQRCLVPSSGFYEWRHWKPEGSKKDVAIPYFVHLPAQEIFFIAGVWQNWTDQATGEHLTGFALLTTAANSLMEQVHNKKKRMPLVLPPELALEWIKPDLSEERIHELSTYQADAAVMKASPIRKDFRTALDPLERCSYEGLPELNL